MVRKTDSSKWLYAFVICTALFLSGEVSAAVTAQVDRYNITVDETVNLSLEVSGDDSGEPELTPLQKEFEILSKNKSSSYSLINGSMNSKSTWFIMLRPRHAGTLIIPALTAGNKKTAAITIQVSQAAAPQSSNAVPQGELWIDMKIEPESVHVQQQAVITLLIYQAVALNQAQLSEPKSDHAVIVRLGEDKSYQQNRNGKNWNVTERRYALFPQQHGSLKLDPVQLDASVMAGRSYGSPFQTTRPIRVRSNALELDVKSMPANWKSNLWLPAKHLQLIENWPEDEFKVGDSITRTLTLTAVGLTSSQLPELSGLLPDHLKAYADKPVLTDNNAFDGVTSLRQEKLAILATRPGTFILPPIDIDWWNSETQSMQKVSLPARTFKVLPAPVDSVQPTHTPQTPDSPAAVVVANNKPDQLAGIWWKWIALLSTLGWLLTLVWFYRKATAGPAQQSHDSDITADTGKLRKAVSAACQQHHAKACEQALLSFAKAQWPNESTNSLASLAKHCDAELKGEVEALESHLYDRQDNKPEQTWQATLLQTAFEQASFTTQTDASTSSNKALPSLYPE